MRIFSILQQAVVLNFPYDENSSIQQMVEFSDDPCDSSVVRIRVTPPVKSDTGDAMLHDAIELTFDRNGRERSRRVWPMKYPAWDQRDPADIDAAMAEAEAKAAAVAEETKGGDSDLPPKEAPAKKGKRS